MLCCRDVPQSCAHHTFLVESCSSKSTVMHEPLVIVSTHGAMCHAIHALRLISTCCTIVMQPNASENRYVNVNKLV